MLFYTECVSFQMEERHDDVVNWEESVGRAVV